MNLDLIQKALGSHGRCLRKRGTSKIHFRGDSGKDFLGGTNRRQETRKESDLVMIREESCLEYGSS